MNGRRIGATLMILVAHLAGCSDANPAAEVSAVAAPDFIAYPVLESGDSVTGEELDLFVGNTVVLEAVLYDTGTSIDALEPSGTADAGVDRDSIVVPIPKYLAEHVIPIPEGVAELVIPIP
jgi:hypothetical protein